MPGVFCLSDVLPHWMLIEPAYVGKNSFERQNDSAWDVGPQHAERSVHTRAHVTRLPALRRQVSRFQCLAFRQSARLYNGRGGGVDEVGMMLSRSLPALLFALGGALFIGFLLWALYWKYKILADPQTRAVLRAGQRPRGFLALGSLQEVISKPSGVLVFLALVTSVLWTTGVMLILSHAMDSGHSGQYSQQASPVRFWLQIGGWGLAMLGGAMVLLWAIWSLTSAPEDRVRLTARVSQRAFAVMDDLVEKPKITLLLYVIAISLGLLMVADSVVSGQIIGWARPSRSSDPVYFWEQIGFWLGMTGWVGVSFLQELRNQFRKREMDRTE
jgi:hypothetical protein